jgi:NCS1 family nucleobase:cation symporter-1
MIFISVLAWTFHPYGGTGSLFSVPIVLTKSQRAFRIVQCISSVGGTWGEVGERFEKKKSTATPAMAITLPELLQL